MKIKLFDFTLISLAIIFLVLANYSLIHSHERSHEEANRIFGCESEVVINFWSGYTEPIDCKLEIEDARALKQIHADIEKTYVFMTTIRFFMIINTIIMIKIIQISRMLKNG